MDAGLLAQYLLVAIAVAASLAYVVATRLPGPVRRWRGWIAMRMVDSGSAHVAAIGRRFAPAPRAGGCGGCDGCGS